MCCSSSGHPPHHFTFSATPAAVAAISSLHIKADLLPLLLLRFSYSVSSSLPLLSPSLSLSLLQSGIIFNTTSISRCSQQSSKGRWKRRRNKKGRSLRPFPHSDKKEVDHNCLLLHILLFEGREKRGQDIITALGILYRKRQKKREIRCCCCRTCREQMMMCIGGLCCCCMKVHRLNTPFIGRRRRPIDDF